MLYSKQKQGRPERYNIHLHGPKQSLRSGRPTEGGDLHEEAQRRPYIAEKYVILIQDNEMRMRRWMFGMTRKYKIRNENIRGTTGVTQAAKCITKRRMIELVRVLASILS